ncbi:hypothetical protein [Cellulosimicrobium sp. RS]|uniref:hypothetical protein n=1 Tax=Cellulosimicrobium sp. RS TaxID=3381347 RepID=UPI0038FBFB64
MTPPKRRRLGDRDEDAILGVIDEPRSDPQPETRTTTRTAPAPAAAAEAKPAPVVAAPPASGSRTDRSATKAPPAGQRRLGTYWQKATFDQARSAYVVDLDQLDDPPVGFARWLERAIQAHSARTPAERAAIAETLGEEDRSGVGVQRNVPLFESTITDAESAVTADRRAGRVHSLSQFVTEAARRAIRDAERRIGGPLPPPPARLPTRPTR